MKDLSNENVIHVKKNGVEYLQFRKLLEYSDIISLLIVKIKTLHKIIFYYILLTKLT